MCCLSMCVVCCFLTRVVCVLPDRRTGHTGTVVTLQGGRQSGRTDHRGEGHTGNGHTDVEEIVKRRDK